MRRQRRTTPAAGRPSSSKPSSWTSTSPPKSGSPSTSNVAAPVTEDGSGGLFIGHQSGKVGLDTAGSEAISYASGVTAVEDVPLPTINFGDDAPPGVRGRTTRQVRQVLGEEFDGIITGVTDFGVFVTLKGMQIDGLVHVTSLGNDYFDHDRTRHRMVGQRSGATYGLTDELRVRVARASLEDRKIDFVPVATAGQPESQPRAARKRRRRR